MTKATFLRTQRKGHRCWGCGGRLRPSQSPKQIIATMKLVQNAYPSLWRWPEDELEHLRSQLLPGDVLSEILRSSIKVRRVDGGEYEFVRRRLSYWTTTARLFPLIHDIPWADENEPIEDDE